MKKSFSYISFYRTSILYKIFLFIGIMVLILACRRFKKEKEIFEDSLLYSAGPCLK